MTERLHAAGSADRTDAAPLKGCTVVVTRERRGELGRLLAERGAEVVHVPLIETVDAEPDDVVRLVEVLSDSPDWVVVTSAVGAERVGANVRDRPEVRTAAVGTATARRLEEVSGRAVDLVPTRQLAEALATEFAVACPTPQRVVLAQADRATGDLATGFREAGHHVTTVTAYRTVLRRPSAEDIERIAGADAVLFASGSAALGWHDALGARARSALPPIVVAIGPTTAAVASDRSLKVDAIATDHSLAGLIDTLVTEWQRPRRRPDAGDR